MTSPNDKKGFLPGKAESMVVNCFKKHQDQYMNKISQLSNTTVSSSSSACPAAMNIPQPDTHANVHISTWNGGITDKYRWSQSISDLTVEIPLTSKLESKTDLEVSLTSTGIKVTHRGSPILHGSFSDRINSSESTWMIEDGIRLIVSVEKSKQTWWKSVLIGDAEIDPTKVESTKHISEYDQETQGAIHKVIHDENQKRLGLPTSAEKDMQDKLRAAWDAPNSPFKGTPYEPSKISL